MLVIWCCTDYKDGYSQYPTLPYCQSPPAQAPVERAPGGWLTGTAQVWLLGTLGCIPELELLWQVLTHLERAVSQGDKSEDHWVSYSLDLWWFDLPFQSHISQVNANAVKFHLHRHLPAMSAGKFQWSNFTNRRHYNRRSAVPCLQYSVQALLIWVALRRD